MRCKPKKEPIEEREKRGSGQKDRETERQSRKAHRKRQREGLYCHMKCNVLEYGNSTRNQITCRPVSHPGDLVRDRIT